MSGAQTLILCIDDDPDILSFLEIVLKSDGYQVVTAASAEEGLEACREHSPDLIILDLMMEEVDAGTSFVKELQRMRNETPIFILSSVGDHLAATTDAASLGLAGVFQKPLSKETLLTVIRMRLRQESGQTEGEETR